MFCFVCLMCFALTINIIMCIILSQNQWYHRFHEVEWLTIIVNTQNISILTICFNTNLLFKTCFTSFNFTLITGAWNFNYELSNFIVLEVRRMQKFLDIYSVTLNFQKSNLRLVEKCATFHLFQGLILMLENNCNTVKNLFLIWLQVGIWVTILNKHANYSNSFRYFTNFDGVRL